MGLKLRCGKKQTNQQHTSLKKGTTAFYLLISITYPRELEVVSRVSSCFPDNFVKYSYSIRNRSDGLKHRKLKRGYALKIKRNGKYCI